MNWDRKGASPKIDRGHETITKSVRKKGKSKIVSLTAYSKSVARLLDKYCDIVLVGDSMANVLYGQENTHHISLQNIIEHSLSVKKGLNKSLLVVDMPKGSYRNKVVYSLIARKWNERHFG